MKSIIASLRSLVLPFGATSGTRLLLDGVNGRLSAFNSSNSEVIRLDAATSTITAGSMTTGARAVIDGAAKMSGYNASNFNVFTLDAAATEVLQVDAPGGSRVALVADSSGSGQAQLRMWPRDQVGTTWLQAFLWCDINSGYPLTVLTGARDNAVTNSPDITLWGGKTGDDTTQVDINADILSIIPTAGTNTSTAFINNHVIPTIATRGSDGSDSSAITTTETVIASLTFTQVDTKTYHTEWNLKLVQSVASDWFLFTVRQNNVTGTIVDAWAVNTGIAGSGVMRKFAVDYMAGASGSKTLVGTLDRLSGTGNITRAAKSNYVFWRVD